MGKLTDRMRRPLKGASMRQGLTSFALLLGMILFWGSGVQAASLDIIRLQVARHPTFTRVVFQLNREAPYEIRMDEANSMLIVVVPGATYSSGGDKWRSYKGPLIKRIERDDSYSGGFRARFLLRQRGVSIKDFTLPKPWRIVLDMVEEGASAVVQLPASGGAESVEVGEQEQLPARPSDETAIETVEITPSSTEGPKIQAVEADSSSEEGASDPPMEPSSDAEADAQPPSGGDPAVREGIRMREAAVGSGEERGPAEGEVVRASPKELFQQGLELYEEGRYREALGRFKQIRSSYPSSQYAEEASFIIADIYFYLAEDGGDINYQMAGEAYSEAEELYPQNPRADWARYRAGETFLRMNYNYEALATFEYFIDKYPKSAYLPYALFNRAEILYALERYEDAAAALRGFLENYPNSDKVGEATKRLADVFYKQGKMAAAIVLYEEVEEKWPRLIRKEPEPYAFMADIYSRRKDSEDLRRVLIYIANIFNRSEYTPRALLRLGDSYLKEKDYRKALLFYDMLIREHPDSPEALPGRMKIASVGEEWEVSPFDILVGSVAGLMDPEGAYRELIGDYPDDPEVAEAMSKLAELLMNQGRYEEAVDLLAGGNIEGTPMRMRRRLADQLLSSIGVLAERAYSAGDYSTVVDINRRNREFLRRYITKELMLKIGESYRRLTLYDDGAGFYNGYLNSRTAETFQGEVLFELGLMYMQGEIFDKAEDAFRRYLTAFPEGSRAELLSHLLGDSLYYRESYVEAIEAYVTAIRRNPSHSRVPLSYYRLGNSLRRSEFFAEAANAYDRAIEVFSREGKVKPEPDFMVDSYFRKADSLFLDGEFEEAADAYYQGLKLFPERADGTFSLYFMSASYRQMREGEKALQILADLKNVSGGSESGFWDEIADVSMDYIRMEGELDTLPRR